MKWLYLFSYFVAVLVELLLGGMMEFLLLSKGTGESRFSRFFDYRLK